MNINGVDAIYVLLLIVIIGCIIGFSVVFLIDRKISDVSINIPRLDVPEPNIVLKINGDDNGNIKVCAKNKQNKQNNKFQELMEHFSPSDKPPPGGPGGPGTVISLQPPLTYFQEKTQFQEQALSNQNKQAPQGAVPESPNNIATDLSPPEIPTELPINPPPASKGPFYIPPGMVQCNNRGGKYKLHADQIACGEDDNKTAENYYGYYYRYPFVPSFSEMRYQGYNVGDFVDFASAEENKRIVKGPLSGDVSRPQIANNQISEYAIENTPEMQAPQPVNYSPYLEDE